MLQSHRHCATAFQKACSQGAVGHIQSKSPRIHQCCCLLPCWRTPGHSICRQAVGHSKGRRRCHAACCLMIKVTFACCRASSLMLSSAVRTSNLLCQPLVYDHHEAQVHPSSVAADVQASSATQSTTPLLWARMGAGHRSRQRQHQPACSQSCAQLHAINPLSCSHLLQEVHVAAVLRRD